MDTLQEYDKNPKEHVHKVGIIRFSKGLDKGKNKEEFRNILNIFTTLYLPCKLLRK